jgi:phosphatidate phosphatase APP1
MGNLGIISDIDDTFLVSYTLTHLKNYTIYYLETSTPESFEDVVPHFQALSSSGRANVGELNAFFYVSSSEWNLYRFLVKFTEIHKLPKAVLLLKDIKLA